MGYFSVNWNAIKTDLLTDQIGPIGRVLIFLLLAWVMVVER